jgi:hypothetical protein
MGADAYGNAPPSGGGGGGGSSGGGGGGGGGGGSKWEWIVGEQNYGNPNAPSWWQPFNIKGDTKKAYKDPEVAMTLMMNAVLGSGALSEEDARNMAKQLYTRWGGRTGSNPWDLYSDKFEFPESGGDGDPARIGQPIVPISADMAAIGQTGPQVNEDYFKSAQRGGDIIGALNNMRKATVKGEIHNFGQGYQYLQNLAGAVGTHGAETRAQRKALMAELDPLLAQSKTGDLGEYNELARMIAQPFFSNVEGGVGSGPRPSKYLTF